MVPKQSRFWLPTVRRELRYPERSCLMYNAYTFPKARRRGYNTLLVRARMADAFLRFGAASVFTSVEAGNESAACAKLATGFRPWKELGLSTRRVGCGPVGGSERSSEWQCSVTDTSSR